MGPRERKAFEREVYGPDYATRTPDENRQRSDRAAAARKVATELKLPQRIVDRAASYAVDGGTPQAAVEKAIIADPDYTPTVQRALRHPDAFVDGMTEGGA